MGGDAADLLARALQADKEGDLIGAINYLEEVIHLSPEDARTRTWLGRLYGNREQYSAAVAMLESSIALDRTRSRSHAALAEVLLELGRWEKAERAVRDSLALKPTSASFVILGCALSAQDRSKEAQQMFRRALELEPGNEEAMYNLALEIRDDDPVRAMALFQDAIVVDPLYADAHREYGFQLAKSLELAWAEVELLASIDLDPSDALAHVYLANVLASTDRVHEAESLLTRASELSPLFALPLWGLGKLRELEGRNQEANALFRQAVSVEPENAEALFQLARFLVNQGRRKEGIEYLDRALREAPRHDEAKRLKDLLSDGAT